MVNEQKTSLGKFIQDNTNEMAFLLGTLGLLVATSALSVPFLRFCFSALIVFVGYQVAREVWDKFPPRAKSEKRLMRFKYSLASFIAVVFYFTFLRQWDLVQGRSPETFILPATIVAPLWVFTFESFSDERQGRIRAWLTRKDKKPLRIGLFVAFEVLSYTAMYYLVALCKPAVDLIASWTRVR